LAADRLLLEHHTSIRPAVDKAQYSTFFPGWQWQEQVPLGEGYEQPLLHIEDR
jgi:hypothetical protein